MKALILAAGIGSRLRPLTDDIPKCMVPVNGVSIIQNQIQSLIDCEVKEIFVVIGYKHEIVKNHITNLGYDKYVKFIINHDYLTTNNMYSLYLAKDDLHNSPFILMNGDVFFEKIIISNLYKNVSQNLIACEKDTYIEESMKISTFNSRISQISKALSADQSYGTSIDLYKFSKSSCTKLFDIINSYINVLKDLNSWSEVAINRLLQEELFLPLDITEKWVEIDNFQDLEIANNKFK